MIIADDTVILRDPLRKANVSDWGLCCFVVLHRVIYMLDLISDAFVTFGADCQVGPVRLNAIVLLPVIPVSLSINPPRTLSRVDQFAYWPVYYILT